YELLDEIMDFGYPQYIEAKILSEFIKTNAYRMEASKHIGSAQRTPTHTLSIKFHINLRFAFTSTLVARINIVFHNGGDLLLPSTYISLVINELEIELASGTYLKQIQVRNKGKSLVEVNLVPL
ncbi:hypothetical protein RYX36_008994, partial [Vicia faba]